LFQLSPPSTAGGAWTESVAFSFGGSNSYPQPAGNLILDQNGNLYGTTTGNDGSVFMLAPQGSTWSEATLYPFNSPTPDVNWPITPAMMDNGSGGFIGSAPGGAAASSTPGLLGAIFQLTPPATSGGKWPESDLHDFSGGCSDGFLPSGSLVYGSGVIYGTTQGGGCSDLGTVFQLSPPVGPGASWTVQLIHGFSGGADGEYPLGGLVMVAGALYGTTSGIATGNSGTIFMVLQAGSPSTWTEVDLYPFQGTPADGSTPMAALTVAPGGIGAQQATFYGTTYNGGTSNNGTVFEATLPVPPNPPAPLSFSAVCEQICFDNSLIWKELMPPPWVLNPQSIEFDGVVQQVIDAGKTVTFAARESLLSIGSPEGSERQLTVTFEHAVHLEPGEHWLLVAKGPMMGLSPKLNLLGFWRQAPSTQK
jgi:uncharacterized repeat protein (TIGR03803 family)